MPHESTKEKPSFLLFGMDCRVPTEAALLPPEPLTMTDVGDYREQLILSLSSARELAATNIQAAQQHYKRYYDRNTNQREYKLGDWVIVWFPHEESSKLRKLSRPWHGPYRIVRCDDTDVTIVKVYFPDEGTIQVHQMSLPLSTTITSWVLLVWREPQMTRKDYTMASPNFGESIASGSRHSRSFRSHGGW